MSEQTSAQLVSVPAVSSHSKPGLVLQRACACGKHTNGGGGECEECKKKRLEGERSGQLQRAAIGSAPTFAPSIVHDVLHSSGQPLDAATRGAIEPRFGQDFSRVRLHTDPTAAASASAVNALAYTVGNHMVFGAGQYAPQTGEGQKLIAHELTHVMQQRDVGEILPSKIMVGPVGDTYEQEANSLAEQTVAPGETEIRQRETTRPLLQRQPIDPGRSDARAEVEYRRAGLNKEANAVHTCRETGNCNMVLTVDEAWRWYQTGRRVAGIDPSNERGAQHTRAAAVPVAVGALAAPALSPAPAAVENAKTAEELAQFFQKGAVAANDNAVVTGLATGGETTTVVTAGEGTAAATGGATAATVAIPIAVGVVLVVSIVSLFMWTSFQAELERQGFTILPDPLACAIGNCHQPTAPTHTFRDFPKFYDPSRLSPFPTTGPTNLPGPGGQISPQEYEKLRRWIEQTAPTNPSQTTNPVPRVSPQPQPKKDREKCPFPTGLSPLDPIPMTWFKPRVDDYYPSSLNIGGITYDRDDPANPKTLPHGQPIGVPEHYWPRLGKLFQLIPEERGLNADRFVAVLRRYGFNWTGLQADHVQDLQWEGTDSFENLWPMSSSANMSAGPRQNQKQVVEFCTTLEGPPRRMTIQEMKSAGIYGRFFTIRSVQR